MTNASFQGAPYTSDKQYKTGTVVVFGGAEDVTISNKLEDTRVAGVIATDSVVVVSGITLCQVVGKIAKGDLLITAKIPGVAVTNNSAITGSVLGKAIESYDSNHIGMIRVSAGRA